MSYRVNRETVGKKLSDDAENNTVFATMDSNNCEKVSK